MKRVRLNDRSPVKQPGETISMPAEHAQHAYHAGIITDDLPIISPRGRVYHPLDKRVQHLRGMQRKIDFKYVVRVGDELVYLGV